MGGQARLYSFSISHPVNTAKMMLDYKGIPFRVVRAIPGLHPLTLRLAGFSGGTVPGLKIDGRKAHGTLAISRLLDEVRPDPPLFPADARVRAKVEEAERWGDKFQNLPRLMFRWSLNNNIDTVEWLMRKDVPFAPAPRIAARLSRPLSMYWAHRAGAGAETVRQALAELPDALDHVDELIAEGVIGGEPPNAADFQIAATVRVCLAAPAVSWLVEGRSSEEWARRLLPDYPGEPIPLVLPPARF